MLKKQNPIYFQQHFHIHVQNYMLTYNIVTEYQN